MRFVFYPQYQTPYNIHSLEQLGWGLHEASGGEHSVIVTIDPTWLLDRADVLFSIDKARPENLPARIRHVAWVQDLVNWPTNATVAPREYYEAKAGPNDLIYTLGDGRSVGVKENDPHWRGSLVEGINPELLNRPYRVPDLDLSFVGYNTQPVAEWEYWSEATKSMLMQIIGMNYRPLRGELDPLNMFKILMTFLAEEPEEQTKQELKHMLNEATRHLDRCTIARLMLSVSENCQLRGANWHRYPEFLKWAEHHTNDREVVRETFQRSRINLQVNITGFGLNSRALECMALGCFLMSHTTVRNRPGHLTECFEPDVHYGVFTPENFRERARYWLDNPEARAKASAKAKKIIAAKHLWVHRGAQILKDLNE